MLQNLNLLTMHLLLPALFVFWVWRWPVDSRLGWWAKALGLGSYVVLILIVGGWAYVNMYLRYVLAVGLVLALGSSFRATRELPFFPARNVRSRLILGIMAFLFSVFVVLTGFAIAGHFVGEPPIDLAFPLRDGTYYVAHGGSSPLINYHNVHPSQRYALDIGKLKASGFRARGLFPKRLERYAIYGETLYAPCEGEVLEVVRDLPDLTPPERDGDNPAGNYVLVRCPGGDVYLAHMQSGSARVAPGDDVTRRTPIGRVGNSGNTTEPHLHVHAETDRPAGRFSGGRGVPIRFDGRFLVRNSLVVRRGGEEATPRPSR